MLSVFRNRFVEEHNRTREGYEVLLSVSGSRPSENWQLTLIDPIFCDGVINSQKSAPAANVDFKTISHYLAMVDNEGPPQPIILTTTSPAIRESPFSFIWEDLEFYLSSQKLVFSFTRPEIGLDLFIECHLNKPLLDIFRDQPGSVDRYRMSYLIQTSIPITGRMNGIPIRRGKSWVDHQWGKYDYLYNKEKKGTINGWRWLGINLEDGSDLIVFQHIEAETREVADSFAALIQNDNIVSETEVDMLVLRNWYSHKTDTNLPVGIRVLVPKLSADLVFTPNRDDQEIPVFGPMRSVWQGAGMISGHLQGRVVEGTARYEMAGYSYIHNLKNHFSNLSKRIDKSIEAFFPLKPDSLDLTAFVGDPYWVHEPFVTEEMISKPAWDLLNRSGKRWRPIFAYYLMKALGIDPRPFEQAAFALAELIHTGSLIIDDIQDGSPKRRGKESIHLKYGQDLAITAGNTLYFLPSLLIMDHPVLTQDQKFSITNLMNRNLIKAHFGQSMDLYWSKEFSKNGLDPSIDPGILERIKQIYALKTGAPVQGLAEAAAIISNSNGEIRNACSLFAQTLGIAFQIIDDIHDFSDSDRWGKLPGEDLKSGNITFAIAYCLMKLDTIERRYLLDLIKSPEKRNNQGLLSDGINIIRNSGFLEECRELAVGLMNESWVAFSPKLPPSDSKIIIRSLTDYLISRSI